VALIDVSEPLKATLPENRCDGPNSWFDYYNVSDFIHNQLGADALFLYMPLCAP